MNLYRDIEDGGGDNYDQIWRDWSEVAEQARAQVLLRCWCKSN